MPAPFTPPRDAGGASDSARSADRYVQLLEHAGDALSTPSTALFRDRTERLVDFVRVAPYVAEVSEFRLAFLREASALRRIAHPRFFPLRAADAVDGVVFGARDHVERVTLEQLLAACAETGDRLPAEVVVHIMIELSTVLGAVHTARTGIGATLHGDITPGVVWLTIDGRVLLAQSGLAVAASRAGAAGPAGLNPRLGYKAPEQVAPASGTARKLDARSDLFALGVILWEALAGHRLFAGESDTDTIEHVIDGPLPAIETVRDAAMPEGLGAIVARALRRDPGQRFQAVAELTAALQALGCACPETVLAATVDRLLGRPLRARVEALAAARRGEPEALETARTERPPPPSGPRSPGTDPFPARPIAAPAPIEPRPPAAAVVAKAPPPAPVRPVVPVAPPAPAPDEELEIDASELVDDSASPSYVARAEVPRATAAAAEEAEKVVLNVPVSPEESIAKRQRSMQTVRISRAQLDAFLPPGGYVPPDFASVPRAPTFGAPPPAPTFGLAPAPAPLSRPGDATMSPLVIGLLVGAALAALALAALFLLP